MSEDLSVDTTLIHFPTAAVSQGGEFIVRAYWGENPNLPAIIKVFKISDDGKEYHLQRTLSSSSWRRPLDVAISANGRIVIAVDDVSLASDESVKTIQIWRDQSESVFYKIDQILSESELSVYRNMRQDVRNWRYRNIFVGVNHFSIQLDSSVVSNDNLLIVDFENLKISRDAKM